MTNDHYILVDKKPVAVSLEEWAEWMGGTRNAGRDWRRVAVHDLNGIRVSTVFLGLDHQWGDGPPILFETMVFIDGEGGHDYFCDRYATWDEAIMGHLAACVMAFADGWKEKQLEQYALDQADSDRADAEDNLPVSEDDP